MTLDSLACPLCLQVIRFFVRRGNAAGYPEFSEEFEQLFPECLHFTGSRPTIFYRLVVFDIEIGVDPSEPSILGLVDSSCSIIGKAVTTVTEYIIPRDSICTNIVTFLRSSNAWSPRRTCISQ